jgi:GNAT superfamily N-acetyltransferase
VTKPRVTAETLRTAMFTQHVRKVTADLPVRQLNAADLPACLDLAADRNWAREEHKWRLLFEVSDVFGLDDPAGGLAGTVVLTRYGPGLAAIGMMLVAARYGRRGLGSRLMIHALEQAPGAVVYLTATDYGRPLYQKLGFRAIDASVTHSGLLRAEPASAGPARAGPVRAEPAAAGPVDAATTVAGTGSATAVAGTGSPRIATDADLGRLAALDAAVFGAPRRNILARLPGFAERVVVAEGRGTVTGFAAAWQNEGTLVVGPVVAANLPIAKALISAVAADASGPVRLDVLGRHAGLSRWAIARGLAAGNETALMVRGGELPGDRGRLFAPVSVAIG